MVTLSYRKFSNDILFRHESGEIKDSSSSAEGLGEDCRIAFVQRLDPVLHTRSVRRGDESGQRFVHRLFGKAEGAVMHGNHAFRAQITEHLQRILGTGVDTPESVGPVGSDGQERDLWG